MRGARFDLIVFLLKSVSLTVVLPFLPNPASAYMSIRDGLPSDPSENVSICLAMYAGTVEVFTASGSLSKSHSAAQPYPAPKVPLSLKSRSSIISSSLFTAP